MIFTEKISKIFLIRILLYNHVFFVKMMTHLLDVISYNISKKILFLKNLFVLENYLLSHHFPLVQSNNHNNLDQKIDHN